MKNRIEKFLGALLPGWALRRKQAAQRIAEDLAVRAWQRPRPRSGDEDSYLPRRRRVTGDGGWKPVSEEDQAAGKFWRN